MVTDINLAVIHARGGSVRVPKKNILPLGGKPLIGYMIEAALSSNKVDKLIISTDDDEISKIARDFGADVPFKRPDYLSWDCPSEDVSIHALQYEEENNKTKVKNLITLQPTTPFTSDLDIDCCVDIMDSNPNLTSVFSAKIVRERPEWMFTFNNTRDSLETYLGEIPNKEKGISQNLEEIIIPNGGVYVTDRNALIQEKSLITKKTSCHIMSDIHSIDIDEPIDFIIAESILKQRKD